MDWIADRKADIGLDVTLISPGQISYPSLTSEGAGYDISPDDVSIDPSYFGKNHEQSRNAVVAWATLTDRRLCVIKNDRVTEIEPVVFHSVAQRIARDRDYLPRSLKRVRHKILYDDGREESFEGYSVHKSRGIEALRILAPGESVETVAFAHNLYNHTGILLEKGCKYFVSVPGSQNWQDGGIETSAEGWDRDGVKLGLKEIAIASMERFRRYPDANWFCLIACVGENDERSYRIGKGAEVTSDWNGELCLFANDLERFYGNNLGKLRVTVKRI